MKKRLLPVLLVLLGALCLCAPGAWAATENGFTYVIYSTGAAISGYNGTDTELIVPDTLGGSPVTQISADAFSSLAVTSITLPDSVTTIGNRAFSGSTIRSVSLPAGLTQLGSSVFQNCKALEAIVIPDGITQLNTYTFDGCTALKDVALGSSLTAISNYAFKGCTSLESLVLPDSVTSIGTSVFSDCTALTDLTLSPNITSFGYDVFTNCPARLYASIGTSTAQALSTSNYSGYAFTDPQYPYFTFKYYSNTKWNITAFDGTVTAVTIPEGVEAISSSAFKNSSIISITLPSTLKSIPDSAFYGCASLASIAFPDSVTSIGKEAFENCTRLASVTLGSGLTTIGNDAFYNCTKLKKVYVPTIDAWMNIEFTSYWSTPMNYADDLYVGGAPLKTLVIPEGTTAIDDRRFYNCKSLVSVTFPASLTSIGESAFSGCESVKEVHIPTFEAWIDIELKGYGSNPLQYSSAENSTLYVGGSPLTHAVIPEGTTTIDKYRFADCTTLTSVDFPDTLTTIGEYAFSDCSSLKSVTLPESVHTIEGYAFSCGENCEITLPDNVTKIGNYAFGYNSIAIVNPDSVTFATLSDLGSEFRYCDKNGGEWVYQVKEDGSLYASGYRGRATDLTFPDNVTGIAGNFDDYMPNRNLVTTIRIPDNVRIIEWNAFIDCNYLTELYLPDNIEEIGGWPFDMHTEDGKDLIIYCSKGSLTSKALGTQDYAFCDLTEPDWLWQYDENETLMLGGYRGSKTSITLPAGVTAIADDAFDHERDEKLVSITIPEGYESIGQWAFHRCDYLAHISLPSTLRTIGEYAFGHCDFTSIQLPEGLETIGEYAFNSCYRMTSLTIPSTVTSISSVIARYCDNLTTVVLPAEIEYIAPGAFGDSLSTVYCYRDTYAQEWAKDNAPLVRLIGEGTLEDLVTLSWQNGYVNDEDYKVTEVGRTAPFMGGVSVGVLPIGANYTFTCTSSDPSVARVDGEILTFLKPGNVTITVAIAERPDVAAIKRTIEVYNPVTAFTVPEAIFVHIDADDPGYIIPENIEPADKDTNPYFRRRDVGQGWWEWCNVKEKPAYGDKGVYFLPEGRLGAIKCEIESFSGVTQPILFVTYDKIGEVYANPPARPLVIGEIWEPDVTVMVDGAELEKLSYLYTLKTSNAKVAAITEDEMIRAVAPGTATITVTARNSGKTAKFTVTVTEAVTLNLPASLKAVSDESFVGMAASEIIIPDGCVSIGARAFADCANLTDVTIPASVTEIAEDAFAGCSGVTITTPASSAAAQMFGGMEGFTVVTE